MPTPSREQLVFTADRNFRLWRYGVGHSQLLLRSLPTDDERCLDVHFEAVTWLSLPTSFDRLTIAARPDLPPGIPPETRLLPDGRSLLTLSLQTSATTGTVVCANVKAAYSAWTPTDPDAEADDVVWALRFA